MRRRVYGIETEYGLTAVSGDTQHAVMDSECAARYLFSSLVQQGRTTNLFLRNGGRLYLDVGSHPEYATAECDTLDDLLCQVRAGEELLVQLADRAQPALQADGYEARLVLIANNGDTQHNSYGCHENYLIHRRRNFRDVADALVTFFITRIILTGAGHISTQAGVPQYVFSHRAEHMWDGVSAATTRTRPIINTRDEPLADTTAYRRLHVIVGDTNIAEPSTALKVGMTELLLTAMEDGLTIGDLALAEPMLAIRIVNSDLRGASLLDLADGRRMSAVQIQREIYHRVSTRLPAAELSPMHTYVLDLWGRGIEAVASEDWSTIDTELDVAIKKKLVDGYRQRSGAALSDPRTTRLLMAYHDISAEGLRPRMEGRGLMRRLTTPQAVSRATVIPPASTRAHLRGAFIAAAQDYRADVFVDWQTLRCDDGLQPAHMLRDPLVYEDPEVDALIACLRDHAPLLPA